MRFFWGAVVLFLISTIFLVSSDFFRVKSVDVKMDKIGCASPDQIKNSASILGNNIFALDSSKVKNVIKNNFLCVKDIQISKKFPNKVSIQALGREIKAQLLATPSAETNGFAVDEEGIIFAESSGVSSIPKIYISNELSLGQMVPKVSDALKILYKVKSYGLAPQEAQVLDSSFIIYPNVDTPKMIFKLENLEVQLASLQLILNQAKIEEKVLEFIDLRFDKPVIILAPKKS